MNRVAPSRFVSRIAFHLAQARSQGLLGEKWKSNRLQKRMAGEDACFQAIAWRILSE